MVKQVQITIQSKTSTIFSKSPAHALQRHKIYHVSKCTKTWFLSIMRCQEYVETIFENLNFWPNFDVICLSTEVWMNTSLTYITIVVLMGNWALRWLYNNFSNQIESTLGEYRQSQSTRTLIELYVNLLYLPSVTTFATDDRVTVVSRWWKLLSIRFQALTFKLQKYFRSLSTIFLISYSISLIISIGTF
jgi:hypothetical protein